MRTSTPSGVQERRAGAGAEDGVDDEWGRVLFEEGGNRGDDVRREERARLGDVDSDIRVDGIELRGDDRGGQRCTARIASVFCAVTPTIAVIPWHPAAVNAFRSAWMPAPPPEFGRGDGEAAGRVSPVHRRWTTVAA